MPKALIDPSRCTPQRCQGGVCVVRPVCVVRAIYQEEPYEAPAIDWARCRACSKCVSACPARAISLTA